MMRNEWNVLFFAYLFQSFIHLFSIKLIASVLGIIPQSATFLVSVLIFFMKFLMFFAMVPGSSFNGKLLISQWRIIRFGTSFMAVLMLSPIMVTVGALGLFVLIFQSLLGSFKCSWLENWMLSFKTRMKHSFSLSMNRNILKKSTYQKYFHCFYCLHTSFICILV